MLAETPRLAGRAGRCSRSRNRDVGFQLELRRARNSARGRAAPCWRPGTDTAPRRRDQPGAGLRPHCPASRTNKARRCSSRRNTTGNTAAIVVPIQWLASPSWRKLLAQSARQAEALLRANAGSSSAARMAMMAMTTSSSMSVKARRREAEGRGARAEQAASRCHRGPL